MQQRPVYIQYIFSTGNKVKKHASQHWSLSTLECVPWCFWSCTSAAHILTFGMLGHDTCQHNCTMERRLVVGFCGQSHYCNRLLSSKQTSAFVIAHDLYWIISRQFNGHLFQMRIDIDGLCLRSSIVALFGISVCGSFRTIALQRKWEWPQFLLLSEMHLSCCLCLYWRWANWHSHLPYCSVLKKIVTETTRVDIPKSVYMINFICSTDRSAVHAILCSVLSLHYLTDASSLLYCW